jgi:hypothetical protein
LVSWSQQLLLSVIESLLVCTFRCHLQAVMTMHGMLVYFAHPAICLHTSVGCLCQQALPLADIRSEHAVTAVAFQPGSCSCTVGYADGRLALLDLAPSAAAAAAAAAAGNDDEAEEPSSSKGSLGVVRWSAVRHASPVVSLAVHPSQPLVMAASR